MKKIIPIIILILFSIQNSFATEWYNLVLSDRILINNITNNINKITDTKWDTHTMKYIFALNSSLKNLNENSRSYIILATIKTNIVAHIQEKNKLEITKEVEKKIEPYKSNINFSDYKIDMEKVRKSWLSYYNDVRKSTWRELYSYADILNNTAQEWSETSMSKWVMSHKRNTWDSYYDYAKITNWFADRWVVCKNVNRATSTENIWRWFYKCSSDTDCTDKLISWTKEVFDMYYAEKNKSYKAHYESIIRKEFRKIWLWVSIHKISNWFYEFYITTHFCTELTN